MYIRLWDRLRDWVLLAVLLAVALVLLLAFNTPVVRGLRATALEGTAWVESHFAWAGGYFRALDENELLREENIILSSEVARSREAQLENERLRRLLGFRDTTALPLHPARIVAKDITRNSYLILNAGRRDSVAVGMPVIDERGVLGKVVLVSEHYSKVMPYLHNGFRLPVKVQPSQASGILRWDGERRDRLVIDFIVKTERVEKGQLVVTSGYSGIFPAGLPVGLVDSVSARAGRNELGIQVTPASPLSAAEYAFVLLMKPDPERLQLAEATAE